MGYISDPTTKMVTSSVLIKSEFEMTKVVLKSDLFGDRFVNVNTPSKLGDTARTGDGSGDCVWITRKQDGYELKTLRRGKSTIVMTGKRTEVLQKAANFLLPY